MITGAIKSTIQGSFKNWAQGGFRGLAVGSATGIGLYSEYLTTGREYGYGAATIRGLAYSLPTVGTAMLAYDIGKMIGDTAYNYQQSKRRLSFTSGFQDPYGNAYTMRQRSQYNLQRGRASLGSEAYLFHS